MGERKIFKFKTKMSSTPQQRKAQTRGSSQIIKSNHEILQYYRNVIAIPFILYLIRYMFSKKFREIKSTVLPVFTSLISIGTYFLMKKATKVTYSPNGKIIYPGMDLTLRSGMPEYMKDIILLIAIIQITSNITKYAFVLLLCIPAMIFYYAYAMILKPMLQMNSQNSQPPQRGNTRNSARNHQNYYQ